VKVKGEAGEILIPPFAKIETMKRVYFHQFETFIIELSRASYAYESFLTANTLILPQLDVSKSDHMEIRNELIDTRRHYEICQTSLLEAISKYSKGEFPQQDGATVLKRKAKSIAKRIRHKTTPIISFLFAKK
jgi:hypothetical protein